MQQAYRVLRVVAEAQTIRIVLPLRPNEDVLRELATACQSLNTESSRGIKAVVLDFKAGAADNQPAPDSPDTRQTAVDAAIAAIHAVEQPVLAVVRGGAPSLTASALVQASDLILVAHEATLLVTSNQNNGSSPETLDTLRGMEAVRLKLATWTASAHDLDDYMERVLNMLRKHSAIALRHAKHSVRTGQSSQAAPSQNSEQIDQPGKARLDALKRVNDFYLANVMLTADAREGLRAFLEKRDPQWRNE